MEDPEQKLTSKILALTGDNEFYFYTNQDEEAIRQGTYAIDENNMGILRAENKKICGYIVMKDRRIIQVIWTNGSYIILQEHSKYAVIP